MGISKVIIIGVVSNPDGGLCLIENCPHLFTHEAKLRLGKDIAIYLVLCNEHQKSTYWCVPTPSALIVEK